MEIIKNNPYRIVGLLVGATAREQEKQIRRLKQFIEAEQAPEEDYSFPIIDKINRSIENINDASSKLNLDSDKINAALFWFYNGNAITDEPALDFLKEHNLDSAIEIWNKLVASGEVSQRNSSAYQNLSTLLLSDAIGNGIANPAKLEHAINLKLKFLESDYVKDFKSLATDETYKTTKKDLQLLFLNQLALEIEKGWGNNTLNKTFLEILIKQNFSAKESFLKSFAHKPISDIEERIEETKSKRKANKGNGIKLGNELYNSAAEILIQLKTILGISNISFSSISDKVSDEVLQCGIDYFTFNREKASETGRESMELFRKAKSLAIGNITKQRCNENTENLQEWIDEKPEREKQEKVISHLDKIKDFLTEFEKRSETVDNGNRLLTTCLPHLDKIKNVLGSTDELYVLLSTRVASDALAKCISEINYLQTRFGNASDNVSKRGVLILLKEKVTQACDVSIIIGHLDVTRDFRNRNNQNKDTLFNLRSQLANVNVKSSSGGCYIATMAYGNYQHPQVIILRQFRDNILKKYILGLYFIKFYYRYSPKLVKKMGNKTVINYIIRKLLNQFIKIIK